MSYQRNTDSNKSSGRSFDRGPRRDSSRDSERKKYDGNWKCSKCGAPITSLPFQPDPSRESELTCFDCHKSSMGDRRGSGGRQFSGGSRFGGNRPQQDRPKFQGNWKCAQCAASITELPFKPDPSRAGGILCHDCYKR